MRSSSFGFFLLSCAFLLLTGAPRPSHASDLSYARIVRVSMVSGDVQISRPGHASWDAAVQNMPVTQGATIGTNDGYAEVQFEDGTTAWISRNTLVQFTELALADGGRVTRLTLAQGTMSVMTQLRRGDTFVLSTSSQTIAVPKNTFFRVDCFHDGASVSVLGGEVQVTTAAGTKTVPKGQTLAYQSKLSTVSLKNNPKPDDWDRWTAARAQGAWVEEARSSSYVNAPFSYGLADMSAYGAWNYFGGMGYGWQPSGVGNCWMPFMNGAWDFYPGFGWTWVSAEPWGWMPYHYGSWDFVPSYGWTWFPSEMGFWNPAPVDWYSAGNDVGWWPASGFGGFSPLAYQQMAGGCGGYGYGGFAGPYGAAGNSKLSHLFRPNRGPMVRGVQPPRLMLTSGQLGRENSIGLVAFDGSEGPKAPMRSEEPLENGKPSRIAFSEAAGSQHHGRMLAPMAPDVARLERSLSLTGTSLSALERNSPMPAAPRESLRAVNAMPTPRMPSRLPSPMPARVFGGSSRGYSQGSTSSAAWSGASATHASSGSSASSAASHASASSGSSGRPH